MNLHHLKIFYLTAKTGSVTKAAKILGLSQPAVSLQLQDFQNKYNFKFFDISGKKVYLTSLGKEIFNRCSVIFDMENQIAAMISDYQDLKNGLLTIFTTSTFSYFCLPSIVTKFKERFPKIIVHVYTYASSKIVDKTINFVSDIGFIGYKIEHPQLIVKEILREGLFVICHPNHKLAEKYVIMPHDLENHDFIANEKSAGTRRAIDKYAEENNIKLNIVAEFDSVMSIIEMVKQNHGISIVSKYVIAAAVEKGEIVGIPIHGGCFRYFYLVYHKEKYISKIAENFMEEAENWCKNYSAENLKKLTTLH